MSSSFAVWLRARRRRRPDTRTTPICVPNRFDPRPPHQPGATRFLVGAQANSAHWPEAGQSRKKLMIDEHFCRRTTTTTGAAQWWTHGLRSSRTDTHRARVNVLVPARQTRGSGQFGHLICAFPLLLLVYKLKAIQKQMSKGVGRTWGPGRQKSFCARSTRPTGVPETIAPQSI